LSARLTPTMLAAVPTLLGSLDRDVPSNRLLLVGGEVCPAELVARFSRPGRRMLNTYAPAETTVTTLVSELEPNRPVTIGRPLPTYTAYILGEDLRPVAGGQVGEICIGGPGVARGYLGRPELTSECFVPDPFSAVPGGRLFRTGDLGRVTGGGELEFLGRSDSQVKLRGYRIDFGEIEAVLREDPDVRVAGSEGRSARSSTRSSRSPRPSTSRSSATRRRRGARAAGRAEQAVANPVQAVASRGDYGCGRPCPVARCSSTEGRRDPLQEERAEEGGLSPCRGPSSAGGALGSEELP